MHDIQKYDPDTKEWKGVMRCPSKLHAESAADTLCKQTPNVFIRVVPTQETSNGSSSYN